MHGKEYDATPASQFKAEMESNPWRELALVVDWEKRQVRVAMRGISCGLDPAVAREMAAMLCKAADMVEGDPPQEPAEGGKQ